MVLKGMVPAPNPQQRNFEKSYKFIWYNQSSNQRPVRYIDIAVSTHAHSHNIYTLHELVYMYIMRCWVSHHVYSSCCRFSDTRAHATSLSLSLKQLSLSLSRCCSLLP